MTAYIAVTVHYISDDWKLMSELLSFQELEGSHTGENQCEHLYSIIKDFNIAKKVRNHLLIELILLTKSVFLFEPRY